jgi:hypothetical protein
MADDFSQTSLFKRFRSTPSIPDPMDDKRAAQVAFDEVLSQLGVRAPSPEPRESEAQYLARLGEYAAAFGPEDRKHVNRYSLPAAALAEYVKQDLEIARQEAHTPHYTLKEGVLLERRRQDQSGRETTEFYGRPSVWMDDFKEPVTKYVSGGSQGIMTTDKPRPPTHNFMKSSTVPELIELQKQIAYRQSPEYNILQAYQDAGLSPPSPAEMNKLLGRK